MKVQSKPLSKEQRERNRRKVLRQVTAAEMKINSGCSLCDQWIAAGLYPGITHDAMHKAHGIHCPMFKAEQAEARAPPMKIEPPDTGRLKGFVRSGRGLKKILAATPTRESPPIVVKLKSYRPHDVLMWAETWRDLYEERGMFLTIQALHNLILHSGLPFDDTADAHATLTALYPEESAREAAEGKAVLFRIEEDKRLAAEAETRKVEDAARQSRIGQRWGVHVELIGKPKVFGHAVGSVIRWMASDCWTFREIRKCLNRLGLKRVRNGTIRVNWKAARAGESTAFLTTDQRNKLEIVVRAKIKKGRK